MRWHGAHPRHGPLLHSILENDLHFGQQVEALSRGEATGMPNSSTSATHACCERSCAQSAHGGPSP